MRHDAGLLFGQIGKLTVARHSLRHAGNGAQGIAVAGVQLLGQQYQRLALGKDGIAAGRVGIVHHTNVGDSQASGRCKLGGCHAHLFHMRLQAALCQLAELRVFAGLRVGGGRDQSAHVGLEFIGNDSIVLFIGHTENIFLRGGIEFQCNGRVGSSANIIIDQRSDGALQAAAAKGLGTGGVPDHGFHQRSAHLVVLALCRPETAVAAQHNNVCIGVEIHQCGPPSAFKMFILHRIDDGKSAVDAAFQSAPEGCCGCRWMETYPAANVCICRQGGKHAAVLQLVPAGFGILSYKTIILHQPGKAIQTAAGAHKSIKHGARCQNIHGFLTPAAAYFQIVQALRQGNAKVYVLQSDVPLIILVFGGIAPLMVVVSSGKVGKLLLFLLRQAGHMAKIQNLHGAPFSRSSFCG